MPPPTHPPPIPLPLIPLWSQPPPSLCTPSARLLPGRVSPGWAPDRRINSGTKQGSFAWVANTQNLGSPWLWDSPKGQHHSPIFHLTRPPRNNWTPPHPTYPSKLTSPRQSPVLHTHTGSESCGWVGVLCPKSVERRETPYSQVSNGTRKQGRKTQLKHR